MATYLFSRAGLEKLESWVARKPLLSFDLDGTLVVVKAGHGDVPVPRGVKENLKTLSRLLPVAIVSGRSQKQIKRIFKIKKFFYVGDHGLEGAHSSAEFKRKKKIYITRTSALKRHISEKFAVSMPALIIEDKKISLTLHFNHTVSPDSDRRRVIKYIEKSETPHRLILGKKVLNCLPTNLENKGTSVLKLMKRERRKAALFIGDDYTDEDVFRFKKRGIFSIRVGRKRTSVADYYLKNQSEVPQVILKILKFLVPSHLN